MRRGQVWKGGPGLCLFNPRGRGSAPVNSRQMPSSVEQAGAVEIGTRFRISRMLPAAVYVTPQRLTVLPESSKVSRQAAPPCQRVKGWALGA